MHGAERRQEGQDGQPGKVMSLPSAQPAEQDDDADHRGPDHHGERVGADEAVLDPAKPRRHPADHRAVPFTARRCRRPRTGPDLGQPLARAHEDRLVERVAVEIVAAGEDERRPAGRLGAGCPPRSEDHGRDPDAERHHHQRGDADSEKCSRPGPSSACSPPTAGSSQPPIQLFSTSPPTPSRPSRSGARS